MATTYGFEQQDERNRRVCLRGQTIAQRLKYYSIPEPNSGCHLWLASTVRGYGQIRCEGKQRKAHRVAWEVANGRPVPDGLCVCHKCDVRACVNPDHLFLGTLKDNYDDMARKGRRAVLRGEKGTNARLTVEQVVAIRADRRLLREIAADYGIDQAHVSQIKLRKRWAHI